MSVNRLRELISALAENRITKKEYAELMDYLRHEADDEALMEAMEAIEASEHVHDAFDSKRQDKLYKGIKRRLQGASSLVRGKLLVWSVAAAIVIFGVSIVLFQQFSTREHPLLASTGPTSVRLAEKSVPLAQRAQVDFPDGTTVWINAGSTLRYPVDYMNGAREVYLEGEAYFDVKPLEGRPFVVYANGVATHVLGTSFNIQAYNEKEVDVSVTSGIVQVKHRDRLLAQLTEDQRAEYDIEHGKVQVLEGSVNSYVAWYRGELILDDMTMNDVAEVLHRQYGIQVYFDKEAVGQCRFTASFLAHEKLNQIISVIAEINKLEYEIQGNSVTFRGAGC